MAKLCHWVLASLVLVNLAPRAGAQPTSQPPPPDDHPGPVAPAPVPPPVPPVAPPPVLPPADTTPVEQPTAETAPEDTLPKGDDESADARGENDKHKGKVVRASYKAGRWLKFHFKKHQSLAVRLTIQPMVRYGQVFGATLPATVATDAADATVDLLIRRARLGFKADLAHNIGFKWEIQIKNMHFGLSNLYGSWKPDHDHEIQFGFLKPPGGLERDAYSFDEPFIERSVVAGLTLDHEMGGKVTGQESHGTFLWQASITRNAPPAVDGGDPEDAPKAPPGGDLADLTRPVGNWNVAAEGTFVPSDRVAVGARAGIRNREELDPGDRIAEPYDTAIAQPRAWTGLMFSAQAYAAVAGAHYRVMTEGGMRRDGHALAFAVPPTMTKTDLTTHMVSYLAYLIVGWTPNGHYGPAADAAPLEDGSEIALRIDGAHVRPPAGATDFVGKLFQSDPIDWLSATIGYHWEVSRNLRLQWDLAVERGRKAEIFGDRLEHFTRVFGQFWATYRL